MHRGVELVVEQRHDPRPGTRYARGDPRQRRIGHEQHARRALRPRGDDPPPAAEPPRLPDRLARPGEAEQHVAVGADARLEPEDAVDHQAQAGLLVALAIDPLPLGERRDPARRDQRFGERAVEPGEPAAATERFEQVHR